MDALGLTGLSSMSGGASPNKIYGFDADGSRGTAVTTTVTIGAHKFIIVFITALVAANSDSRAGGLPPCSAFYMAAGATCFISASREASTSRLMGSLSLSTSNVLSIQAYSSAEISGTVAVFT